MDKPINKRLTDFLSLKVSEKTGIPEDICDKVISWSYLKAKEATESNRSIELSGFGKLLLSPAKIKRRIKGQETAIKRVETILSNSPSEKAEIREKINLVGITKKLEFLKNKLDEISMEGDPGRVEK